MNGDDEVLFMRRLSRSQLVRLDAVVAAGYTVVLVVMTIVQSSTGVASTVGPTWAGLLLVLAMGVPLAVRRVWPMPVFAIVFAASLLALVLGVVSDGFLGAAFALYVVALSERRPHREPTLLIAALSLIGTGALVAAGSPLPLDASLGSILVGSVVLAGAWTIGRAVRERRRFAERSAAELVEHALTEERLRIARDLHDVVAHGLSLIVVKAGTANHVAAARPEEAHDALRVIEATGRAALVEMRHMLDVLRTEEPAAEDGDLAPAPTLEQLPALAGRVAMAGVHVEFDLDGVGRMPDGVNLAIYRIVQEALTNVVKHAAPARCRIAIASIDGEVQVEIVDDGFRAGLSDDPPVESAGHGLIGLGERVRLLGGDLVAGPLPGRGWRVCARIPYVLPATPAAGLA